jgi:hypothetical protein
VRWLGLLMLGLLLSREVAAANLRSAVVDETQAHRYRVRVQMDLDAPRNQVFAVLTDYAHYARLNHDIERAQVLGPGALQNSTRVETWIRACVAFFCHDLHQLEDVSALSDAASVSSVAAEGIPEEGGMRFSRSRWDVKACGQQTTCLGFYVEVEPDFWVPPLLGTWLIQRTLRNKAVETCEQVERLAQQPSTQ